uniref:Uncharacterized protein n=1 Tax=Oryza punctata TaxID=4537 RepID=A0A0E0JG21_ORYPU
MCILIVGVEGGGGLWCGVAIPIFVMSHHVKPSLPREVPMAHHFPYMHTKIAFLHPLIPTPAPARHVTCTSAVCMESEAQLGRFRLRGPFCTRGSRPRWPCRQPNNILLHPHI